MIFPWNCRRNRRTGLCISEGMMVIHKVIPTGCRDGLELVVGKPGTEMPPGGRKGIMEFIVRVVHPINSECRLQAPFIEAGIVRHQGKALDQGFNLLPHTGKHRSIVSVFRAKPVDPLAEPLVVFRFRMDQAVEGVRDLSVTYYHDSDGTHA